MFRRILCILSAVGMTLIFSVSAQAEGVCGAVRVLPQWAGSNVCGGQVAIYRIGDLTPQGCRITDGLADWMVYQQELESEEFLQWSLEQNWKESAECVISADEGAYFPNLSSGLYLVVQKEPADGYYAFHPFLAALSLQQDMCPVFYPDAVPLTEPPGTGDYPSPIITSMILSMGVVLLMIMAENRKK